MDGLLEVPLVVRHIIPCANSDADCGCPGTGTHRSPITGALVCLPCWEIDQDTQTAIDEGM
jgi:hypothetical protein